MLPKLKVDPESGFGGELSQMLAAIQTAQTLGKEFTSN